MARFVSDRLVGLQKGDKIVFQRNGSCRAEELFIDTLDVDEGTSERWVADKTGKKFFEQNGSRVEILQRGDKVFGA